MHPPERVPDRGPVRRDSLIYDVMLARPEAERVLFEELGLPCYRCEVSLVETVEQGARLYGLDPERVVARLNECPLWPPTDSGTPGGGPGAP